MFARQVQYALCAIPLGPLLFIFCFEWDPEGGLQGLAWHSAQGDSYGVGHCVVLEIKPRHSTGKTYTLQPFEPSLNLLLF